MKARLVLTITVILLSACATSYQPQGWTGGFSATQLDENVFQVSFKGNAVTSSERASDFNLLRSAEIAMENGYQYFVIVESESFSKKGAYATPSRSYTTGSVSAFGNYSAKTRTTGGQTYFYSKPRSTNTIICFEEKPKVEGVVYEAAFVAQSIRQKYDMTD